MKRVIVLLMVIICALLTVGCGERDNSAETDSKLRSKEDSSSGSELDGSMGSGSETSSYSVKDEGIKADLSDEESFFKSFDNNYSVDMDGNFAGSEYTIDGLTIDRRKINEEAGTDDVYVTAVSSNGLSKYTGTFHLLYSLYDVGGWCLDSVELESGQLEPLSGVPDADAYNIALDLLSVLGCDTDDSWIKSHEALSSTEETVVVGVDFNDGILAVQGTIELLYYHDGVSWNYDTYSDSNLTYDILAEGTYRGTESYTLRYVTINHENGRPVIRTTSAWYDEIDPFHVREWPFDCLSRSYIKDNSEAGMDPNYYYLGKDGNIYDLYAGTQIDVFYRIADPITDAGVLEQYEEELKEAKRAQ